MRTSALMAAVMALTASGLVGFAESSGFFKVKFLKYHNPRGVDTHNVYCEGRGSGACEYYLKVTLRGGGKRENWIGGETASANVLEFGSNLGNGVPNPVVVHFSAWTGELQYRIEVWDADAHSDDFMDSFSGALRLQPTRAWAPRTLRRRGASDIYLSLQVLVACDSEYFGPSCTKHCSPHNDSRGHFTCDKDGNKVCLTGWRGAADGCWMSDVCARGLCPRGAACTSRAGGTRCLCPGGAEGTTCLEAIKDCLMRNGTVSRGGAPPCLNGGCCTDALGGHRCACPRGFTGPRCADDVDECAAPPGPRGPACANGGRCVNTRGGFVCRCPPEHSGERCEAAPPSCEALLEKVLRRMDDLKAVWRQWQLRDENSSAVHGN